MITLERELAARDPLTVSLGRELVVRALPTGTPAGVVDDAVLAVSELLTNAVAAARRCVRLVVDVVADRLTLWVFDDGPGSPHRTASSPARTGGRGLAIVETVADAWGVRPDVSGKWVWAAFPTGMPALSGGRGPRAAA